MLAEKLGISAENAQMPEGDVNLRDFLLARHSSLHGLTFSIAIDLEYGEQLSSDKNPNKIDVMPPFAGG